MDISFSQGKEVNYTLMIKNGMCLNLKTLIVTGWRMNSLIYDYKAKGKSLKWLQCLLSLKIGRPTHISDQIYQLRKRSSFEFCAAQQLVRIFSLFLNQLKAL